MEVMELVNKKVAMEESIINFIEDAIKNFKIETGFDLHSLYVHGIKTEKEKENKPLSVRISTSIDFDDKGELIS